MAGGPVARVLAFALVAGAACDAGDAGDAADAKTVSPGPPIDGRAIPVCSARALRSGRRVLLAVVEEGLARVYRFDGDAICRLWSAPADVRSKSIAWGDYDGDGDPDLAIASFVRLEPPRPSQVYRNDGDRLSLVWTNPELLASTARVDWADYDGDGRADLALANLYPYFTQVFRGTSDGLEFAWSTSISHQAIDAAWGDYDQDGDPDLVVAYAGKPNEVYENLASDLVLVWQSDRTGGDNVRDAAWADYDGDGDLDFATGGGVADRIYRNEGQNRWVSVAAWGPFDTWSAAWADHDGDGDLDFWAGCGGPPMPSGSPAFGPCLYENRGGVFAWSHLGISNGLLDWGDYDGDGDPDLAAGPSIYRNDAGRLVLVATFPWIRELESVPRWAIW
jgi:hypothetical protein